jgi:hypothetical protein
MIGLLRWVLLLVGNLPCEQLGGSPKPVGRAAFHGDRSRVWRLEDVTRVADAAESVVGHWYRVLWQVRQAHR